MEKMTRNSEALELDVAIKFVLFSCICCLDTDAAYIRQYFVDSHPVNAKTQYLTIQGNSNN